MREELEVCNRCVALGTDLSNHDCNPEEIRVQFSQADRERIKKILDYLEVLDESRN